MAEAVQTKAHGVIAKSLHWGFVVLYVYAIAKGLESVEAMQDRALLHFEMVFAAVFLAVLGARYLYMRFTMPTAMSDENPRFKRYARWGHLAMYGTIAMIAVTGMMMGALFMHGFEGSFVVEAFAAVHVGFVNLSYILIGGHIVMAVLHRLKGDGIWTSMVPIWKEKVGS